MQKGGPHCTQRGGGNCLLPTHLSSISLCGGGGSYVLLIPAQWNTTSSTRVHENTSRHNPSLLFPYNEKRREGVVHVTCPPCTQEEEATASYLPAHLPTHLSNYTSTSLSLYVKRRER